MKSTSRYPPCPVGDQCQPVSPAFPRILALSTQFGGRTAEVPTHLPVRWSLHAPCPCPCPYPRPTAYNYLTTLQPAPLSLPTLQQLLDCRSCSILTLLVSGRLKSTRGFEVSSVSLWLGYYLSRIWPLPCSYTASAPST